MMVDGFFVRGMEWSSSCTYMKDDLMMSNVHPSVAIAHSRAGFEVSSVMWFLSRVHLLTRVNTEYWLTSCSEESSWSILKDVCREISIRRFPQRCQPSKEDLSVCVGGGSDEKSCCWGDLHLN